MNRTEEYAALLAALDAAAPALDLAGARRRRRRRRLLLRPLAGLAAVFVLFVGLVNCSLSVAYACARIPGLRELAEAVTFSRSLTEAVKREYVQPLSLTETKQGLTLSVDYLIVDQKQLNVFYRLEGGGETLAALPGLREADGSFCASCSVGGGMPAPADGTLQTVTVDFFERDMPAALLLDFTVVRYGAEDGPDHGLYDDPPEPETLAEFSFPLDFDPTFTAAGTVLPVEEDFLLDGQRFTVTGVELYPTHLRLQIAEDPANTVWLRDLGFYIEADESLRFDPVSEGITASGAEGSDSYLTYRADSLWFHEANRLRLVITDAVFLEKDRTALHFDLATGVHDPLPEGVTALTAEPVDGGWRVRAEGGARPNTQLFGLRFLDGDGTEHEIPWVGFYDGVEELPLEDFTGTAITLFPTYTGTWRSETPICLTLR